MTLFEQASLVITPNAVKAGKLYSIKPSDGTGDLDVVRATTATRVNEQGLIETVPANVARLDYSNGSCPSILVEPQRTNLYTYSQQLNEWDKSGAFTVTENDSISPDGTQNADRVQFATSGDLLFLSGTGSAGLNTISVYAKAKSGTSQNFRFFANGGLLFSSNQVATEEWQRFTFTYTFSALTSGLAASTTGVSDVLFFGFQHEAGANATSYIPTVASAVTRNADVISKTGISSLIGQQEGTIYAEVDAKNLISGTRIFAVGDGSTSNRIVLLYNTTNRIRALVSASSVIQADLSSSSLTFGTFKIALSYANNDIAFYINGVQIETDTSATIPACANIYLGVSEFDSASQLNDHIKSAAILPTRLSNAQLEALTTL